MTDQDPFAGEHTECAHEINRLQNENRRLRAALAQKAEPDEQEVALQKIADFGQDQVMTPDVLISKLANLRAMAAGRNVPEVDLATIDLAIEHLRFFSVTPSHRLSDERMVEAATYEAVDAPGDADEHVCAWSMDQVAKGWWK